MNRFFKHTLLAIAGLSALSLSACGKHEPFREEVAARLASPAWMIKRPVNAGPFVLTAFERMHERGETATLYIEGDGEAETLAPALNDTALFNPTPHNPVALHLASRDKSKNLAYIARPCQYSGLLDKDGDCRAYWGEARFDSETVNAYNAVLDGIKARYGVTDFNLVGYDGGATLAALLAAGRKDVLSLRTVAGRFDVNALGTSLPRLRTVPQHHFIGGQDMEGSPAELHTYLQALGDSQCVEHTLIHEAEHEKGWVNKWPELLKTNVPQCYVEPEPEFIPIVKPEPIYVPRMGGSKK
ncbi:MAG: hypothetical protein R3E13_05300 [Alphaproteobacteria bacterium]